MTEDDNLVYDIDSDWEICNPGPDKKIYFENKRYSSLFRIIDIENEKIIFSDVDRINKITDINKVLVKEDDNDKNIKRYLPIVNRVLDDVKPVSMPYKPEKYKCFIEAFPAMSEFDDILGVLYFKEEFGEENMVEAKRFFRIHLMGELGPKFEEINLKVYNDLKTKWMEKEKVE